MHLHALSFGALGPFAGEHEIDFDALGGSALFLIDGPTGAGKSTVIDAIVFALYGSVAGQATDRQRLRSDYADPQSPSYAELDFSTAFGRFRVRRTPEFERAKLRGTGTTTAPSSVSLLRSTGGQGWEPVSSRVGEVDAEVARIVGLSRAQFLQTVVLPQGEFAAFLSAESADRLAVLERIFATDLYSRIEEVLDVERRRALAEREAADETVARSVRHVTSRLSDDDAVTIDASSPTLEDDLDALVTTVRERLDGHHAAVVEREVAERQVAERVRELEATVAARDRVVKARLVVDQAREREATARSTVDIDVLAGLGVANDPMAPEEAVAALDRAMGALDSVLADEQRLPADRAAVSAAERQVEELAQRIADLEAERDVGLPGRLQQLAAALTRHARLAEQELAVAAKAEADLVRSRLEGMSAELADGLVDGQPCPVCGALDHPAPADPAETTVTADDVAAAVTAREQADARRQRVLLERAALGSVTESDDDGVEAPGLSLPQIARAAADVRERSAGLQGALQHLLSERAAAVTGLQGLVTALTGREAAIEVATAGVGTVTDRVQALRSVREAVVEVGHAVEAVVRAEAALAEAEQLLAPDSDEAVTQLADQRAVLAEVAAGLRSATSARDAGRDLLRDLGQRVAEVRAARVARDACWEATADVIAVAAMVRGTAGNRLAQPLSAYVVQTMFDEMLEAANRRLRTMLDGRFELQSTEGRTGRRLGRQGLGLQVLDLRTDTVRRTSTLSGGETFCASLALALGLADTVRAHAGGIDLGMLIIDEGFGSLDGDRLDEVMAELLRLRADGRTVGVISHVAEMKRSIPERIDVRPLGGRGGSTLEVSWMT